MTLPTRSFFSSCFLLLASCLLLLVSFPRYDIWICVWFALAPWLWLLDSRRPMAAFGWSYLLGILFFAGTVYWIIHVTLPGMILLILYLALYFALFGLGYALFSRRPFVQKLFWLPSLWVALEFIRGHLFSGFNWGSLAHSQYKNLVTIQIADITGVAGISFLIVMVNLCVKEGIRLKTQCRPGESGFKVPFIVVGLLLVLSLGYGIYRLNEPYPAGESARIAVVQANIAQEIKWNKKSWPSIMELYKEMTRQAITHDPDMIIWPETSFPGFPWEDPRLFEELKDFVSEGRIPLIAGVVNQMGQKYYNSAVLLSSAGEVTYQYDKLHLVPFGEYIPFRKIFPFLAHIVPIDDFTPGEFHTLFPVGPQEELTPGTTRSLAVLICFEDTLPYIAREFSRRGAGLLVNITNDAWFKDTNEPFLHLANAVFRTVENRKGLVRAANTGVSCFIDAKGRIYRVLRDSKGKSTYVSGHDIAEVNFNGRRTLYTKLGDVFTYLCFGCILILSCRKRSRK